MPLPKNTIRVFPNPWSFVHHELGPQGRCHEDTGGRGSDPRYIGAEPCPKNTQKLTDREKEPTETRLDRWRIVFRFPALLPSLLAAAAGFEQGIELPKTPYYLDRLRDGDLVPADKRTASDNPCRFKSLADAKAAAIVAFEENYDAGSFAEAFPELSDKKPEESAPAEAAPPLAFTTSSEVATTAETPNAKRARTGAGADK